MSNQKTNTKDFENEKQKAKILDRIRKLLAVAEGTQYEGEANTALRMAQSYMRTYGLSRTEVEISKDLEGEIVYEMLSEHANRKNPERWEEILCRAVGKTFDCKAIQKFIGRGKSKMMFLGFKDDVEMAKIVFAALYTSCRATACKKFPEGAGKIRLSFMLGVASRLYERAKEEKQKACNESTGKFSLVVVGKETKLDFWAKENLSLKNSRSRGTIPDPHAFAAGLAHGNSMDLMNRQKVHVSTAKLIYKK